MSGAPGSPLGVPLQFAVRSLRTRALLRLGLWSVPEMLPAVASGYAVAQALDHGFLAGEPVVGLAWLGVLLVAAAVAAVGARQVYRNLGDLVEPFRDALVTRVVGGALTRAVRGAPEDGALTRLTHQVELARDAYAGTIVVLRTFTVAVVGAVVGLSSVDIVVLLVVLPPFLAGLGLFVATLGLASARQLAYVRADERLAEVVGPVLAGNRDITAAGAQGYAGALAVQAVRDQAAAERALAPAAAVRSLCFAIGGVLPLLALLLAGPWLIARGVTTGAVLGGVTYVASGLRPAFASLVQGLGSSGLRLLITLGRILDGSPVQPAAPRRAAIAVPRGYDVRLCGVTFAYGPHTEPVLRDLDLVVPEGDHLAVVGPSGVGKSTLASLICGLRGPDTGTVTIGGRSLDPSDADTLYRHRVLIPQEAYVFGATVRENLTYLRPDASTADIRAAIEYIGAAALVSRLGGLDATVRPQSLSAGERQMISLVRAYLAPASVAVLDEAACYLDPAAERRAEEAFAARDGTLIVIAHRVSSALRARRVLVLDGVSAALGDHATLSATSPLYRELLGHWGAGDKAPVAQIQPAS
jgi:ATP-binding cassette subfamily C protein